MIGAAGRAGSAGANHPARLPGGAQGAGNLRVVQGVIKSYDPGTRTGSLLRDTDLAEIELGPNPLAGSILRMVRQGQRVVFDLDGDGRAVSLRLGSEVDMATPGYPDS